MIRIYTNRSKIGRNIKVQTARKGQTRETMTVTDRIYHEGTRSGRISRIIT